MYAKRKVSVARAHFDIWGAFVMGYNGRFHQRQQTWMCAANLDHLRNDMADQFNSNNSAKRLVIDDGACCKTNGRKVRGLNARWLVRVCVARPYQRPK